MSEGVQTLNQRIEQQTIQSVRAFRDDSIARLKSELRGDRAELENLLEHLPESQQEAKARIREIADSYAELESALDHLGRDPGAEDAPNGAVEQAREAVEESIGQVERRIEPAHDEAGSLPDEDLDEEKEPDATEAARQKAEELDVDLYRLIGSGAEGRITVRDVVNAAEEGEEEEPEATEAARHRAGELGVNLYQLVGSGAEGRITVKDVVNAADRG